MDKHTAYYNILAALPQAGCAVCRLGHDVEVKYIRDVLYSKTTSIRSRVELRAARGYCLNHARQLDEIGQALDVSIVYQDILTTLKQALEGPSSRQVTTRRGRKQLSDALAAEIECPACTYRAEMEAIYIETFLDHLADPEFVAQVRSADPLCLAHFRQVIEEGPSAEQFQALREAQIQHWEQLITELGEFVRKNDYRYHDEPVGPEGTAWLRAVDAVAGTREF